MPLAWEKATEVFPLVLPLLSNPGCCYAKDLVHDWVANVGGQVLHNIDLCRGRCL